MMRHPACGAAEYGGKYYNEKDCSIGLWRSWFWRGRTVLPQPQKKIEKNTGTELEVGYILDLREFPDDPYGDRVVHDIQVILDDPEVGYVAECMGGVNPAFDFVRRCLEAGKSVATSNKQLVAEKGDILLQVAKAHHVNFFFEASVGGAIPIIRPLHTCLAAMIFPQ